MQSGRLEDAARLWSQVLAAAPEHPQALFHLGQHKLMQKDQAAALDLLERAAKADPAAPAIPLNVAFVYRASGNTAAEIAALDRALAIDPYFFPALLAKGTALNRAGRRKLAAQVYKAALTIAPPDDQLVPEMRKQLELARKNVAEDAEQLDRHLEARIEGFRSQQTVSGVRRAEMCKDVILGRRKVYVQQPSMLHFPELPAIQFYDREMFDWLLALEACTDAIRAEFLNAYGKDNGAFVPYVDHPEGAPLNQWQELNRSSRWSVLFLWKDGQRMDEACARCPVTAAAVEAAPQAHIPNFAPTANFSVLAPRTRIPPHTGSTNVRLIVHLPLIVPDGCTYRVGNETRVWEEGKAWVFDDTIEHEAWNGSDEPRVILMFDIWNPLLSPAERQVISALLNGLQSYYGADAPVQFGG
ncbi:MAG: aspartyl/asparaginyl beta-hydroxylase domain-containing protein [Alphaproteobacteria bacterium]|nr:aspartyl/asparaginyl beta-hydroxylase domain-containing protein [Alphaproteobacteria bacterium]